MQKEYYRKECWPRTRKIPGETSCSSPKLVTAETAYQRVGIAKHVQCAVHEECVGGVESSSVTSVLNLVTGATRCSAMTASKTNNIFTIAREITYYLHYIVGIALKLLSLPRPNGCSMQLQHTCGKKYYLKCRLIVYQNNSSSNENEACVGVGCAEMMVSRTIQEDLSYFDLITTCSPSLQGSRHWKRGAGQNTS